MTSEEQRCAEAKTFARIDAAFRAGDLDALRAAVDDPGAIPNGVMPLTIVLLDAGADPALRTRIDDGETPVEMANAAGLSEIAAMLSR